MKFTFGLLAGIAIGAAVVHYLNTREGKALVDKIKDDADEIGEELSSFAEDLVEKGKSIISSGQPGEDSFVEETVIVVIPDQPQAMNTSFSG